MRQAVSRPIRPLRRSGEFASLRGRARLPRIRNTCVMQHTDRVRRASCVCYITHVFRRGGVPGSCFARCLPGIHAGLAACGRVRTVRHRGGGPPATPKILGLGIRFYCTSSARAVHIPMEDPQSPRPGTDHHRPLPLSNTPGIGRVPGHTGRPVRSTATLPELVITRKWTTAHPHDLAFQIGCV